MELKPFKASDAEVMRSWFHDANTKKWLGNASWIDNIFRLQAESPGVEHRGQRRVAFYPFMAYVDGRPVGFIDAGVVDRFLKYGGGKDGKPIYSDIEIKMTATISFLIKPVQRGYDYGVRLIKALVERPEVRMVRIFEAGVDPGNASSVKTFEKAGFVSDYVPDFEDMIYFLL